MTPLGGIIAITNSSGDNESTRKMLLSMFTSAKVCPPSSSSTRQFFLPLEIIIIISLMASFTHQLQLVVFHWSLSDSKTPQVSRTVISILADL